MVALPASFDFCVRNAGFQFGGDVRLKNFYCKSDSFNKVEWSNYESTHHMGGSQWADPLRVKYKEAQPSESLAPLLHLSSEWF